MKNDMYNNNNSGSEPTMTLKGLGNKRALQQRMVGVGRWRIGTSIAGTVDTVLIIYIMACNTVGVMHGVSAHYAAMHHQ